MNKINLLQIHRDENFINFLYFKFFFRNIWFYIHLFFKPNIYTYYFNKILISVIKTPTFKIQNENLYNTANNTYHHNKVDKFSDWKHWRYITYENGFIRLVK